MDTKGNTFEYAVPDPVQEYLHLIDQSASGRIETAAETITSVADRERYIVNSLVEEAITSSQLEGATTTRRVAREMIRSARPPRDISEQMILNNYRTMSLIRTRISEPMSKELLLEFHRTLTDKTIDISDAVGRFRLPHEHVKVYASVDDAVLHDPPPADSLEKRIQALCDFANERTPDHFVHPVIRAVILHFWLAYDHPFVDGNGRCARALFYWAMLRSKYWLAEFISISQVIRKGPARYGRAYLYTENDENDLTYYVLYHLDVIVKAIEDVNRHIKSRTTELKNTAHLLRAARLDLNARQRDLLTHALKNREATYTIKAHQNSNNIVYETARSDLLELSAMGFLEKAVVGRAHTFTPASDLEHRIKSYSASAPTPSADMVSQHSTRPMPQMKPAPAGTTWTG